jgi:hypothetical protein
MAIQFQSGQSDGSSKQSQSIASLLPVQKKSLPREFAPSAGAAAMTQAAAAEPAMIWPFDFGRIAIGPPASKAGGMPEADSQDAQPQQLAQDGTHGSGEPLPYLAEIQQSFGRHDVSDIQAYTGPAATEAAHAMGASVAFAGEPDLPTAAHEAAHVVQQRSGLQLAGGVGQPGDSHEQHADAVADRVVQGQSSEALLDSYAQPAAAGSSGAVQRSSVIQCSPLVDVVAGFVKQAGVQELGHLAAEQAAPLIAELEELAGPAALQAVHAFLDSPAGRQLLRMEILSRLAKEIFVEVGQSLVAQIRLVCEEQFGEAFARMRTQLGAALANMPPAFIEDFMERLDEATQPFLDNAIVRQTEAAVAWVFNTIVDVVGALAQGAVGGSLSAGMTSVANTVAGSGRLVSMATKSASQAVTNLPVYKGVTTVLSEAQRKQKMVLDAINSAEGMVDAAEAMVLERLPQGVTDALTKGGKLVAGLAESAADVVGKRFPNAGEALRKIKPGLPGTAKRSGKYAANKLLGDKDHLAAAQQGVDQATSSATAAAGKATEAELAKKAARIRNFQRVVQLGQFANAMAHAPPGHEAEVAGKTAAELGLAWLGSTAGASAASLLPATLAASSAAPIILAGALGYAATNTELGQVAINFAGSVAEAATTVPLLGPTLKKVTQSVAVVCSAGNAGLQYIRPTRLGGSDEAADAAREQCLASKNALLQDLTPLWTLLWQVEADPDEPEGNPADDAGPAAPVPGPEMLHDNELD